MNTFDEVNVGHGARVSERASHCRLRCDSGLMDGKLRLTPSQVENKWVVYALPLAGLPAADPAKAGARGRVDYVNFSDTFDYLM